MDRGYSPSKPTVFSLLLGLAGGVLSLWDGLDRANSLQVWLSANKGSVLGHVIGGFVENFWLFVALGLILWWHDVSARTLLLESKTGSLPPKTISKIETVPARPPAKKPSFNALDAATLQQLRARYPDRPILDESPYAIMRKLTGKTTHAFKKEALDYIGSWVGITFLFGDYDEDTTRVSPSASVFMETYCSLRCYFASAWRARLRTFDPNVSVLTVLGKISALDRTTGLDLTDCELLN